MSETFYLLVCRDCGNGELVMPFASAAERGKWAAGHTRATGHERWFVRDEPRAAGSESRRATLGRDDSAHAKEPPGQSRRTSRGAQVVQ